MVLEEEENHDKCHARFYYNYSQMSRSSKRSHITIKVNVHQIHTSISMMHMLHKSNDNIMRLTSKVAVVDKPGKKALKACTIVWWKKTGLPWIVSTTSDLRRSPQNTQRKEYLSG